MKTAFLGKTVSGPFTIPSGIVSTAPSIIQRIIDELPEVGVITTKSVGPVPRTGNREPVYSQYAPGCFVNAVGLTNPGAEEALKGFESLSIPEDRFLLVSRFVRLGSPRGPHPIRTPLIPTDACYILCVEYL